MSYIAAVVTVLLVLDVFFKGWFLVSRYKDWKLKKDIELIYKRIKEESYQEGDQLEFEFMKKSPKAKKSKRASKH